MHANVEKRRKKQSESRFGEVLQDGYGGDGGGFGCFEREGERGGEGMKKGIQVIEPSKSDCKHLIEDSVEFLKIAEDLFTKEKWNLVVKNCIDSMELSLKAVLGLIIGKYPATHDFQDKKSRELYGEAMEIINRLEKTKLGYFQGLFLTRLFFITGLWSKSYTNSKYGDVWNVNVYQKLESEFIIKQTREFVENVKKGEIRLRK